MEIIEKKDNKGNKKDPQVIVKNITKKFYREYKTADSALSRVILFISGRSSKRRFKALNNISFVVRKGENLGIIGRNGSGKSTLLRIMAGIYKPDSGFVNVRGKLVYLSGFGQGLNKKLTMRENIYLIGSLMGLAKKDIDDRLDEIVEFSGLEEYLDTKVYQFSSGMVSRLNFSITIFCVSHKKPDVLLIDEAIGGGADIIFQKKALLKIEELVKGGSSVILVSHSLDHISKYCKQSIWIEEGEIVMKGKTKEVIDSYVKKFSDEKDVKRYLNKKKKLN